MKQQVIGTPASQPASQPLNKFEIIASNFLNAILPSKTACRFALMLLLGSGIPTTALADGLVIMPNGMPLPVYTGNPVSAPSQGSVPLALRGVNRAMLDVECKYLDPIASTGNCDGYMPNPQAEPQLPIPGYDQHHGNPTDNIYAGGDPYVQSGSTNTANNNPQIPLPQNETLPIHQDSSIIMMAVNEEKYNRWRSEITNTPEPTEINDWKDAAIRKGKRILEQAPNGDIQVGDLYNLVDSAKEKGFIVLSSDHLPMTTEKWDTLRSGVNQFPHIFIVDPMKDIVRTMIQKR